IRFTFFPFPFGVYFMLPRALRYPATLRYPTKVRTAVMLALVSCSGFANENDTTTDTKTDKKSAMPTIEVIRVSGSQQTHRYDETGSVFILDREAIERVQALSTEDVLRRIPGINIK